MEVIKFRGYVIKDHAMKGKNTGWVHGGYCRQPLFDDKNCGHLIFDLESNHVLPVEEKSLGQFVGHYYLNGEEVYEGDIITTSKAICDSHGFEYAHDPSVIIYSLNNSAFIHKNSKHEFGISEHNMKRMEKIGTLFENPELLK